MKPQAVSKLLEVYHIEEGGGGVYGKNKVHIATAITTKKILPHHKFFKSLYM